MSATLPDRAAVSRAGRRRRFDELLADIAAYYGAKAGRYKATPLGVDWSCRATQELRFVQLLKLCDFAGPFSLNDIGCGYGALVAFLSARYPAAVVDYLGLDVSPTMVCLARRVHPGGPRRRFAVGQASPRAADYSVASGIMNVKLARPRDQWEAYVAEVLRDMHRTSRLGFAVNFIAAAAPTAAPTDEPLYRTDPDRWIRFCRTKLGCAVETVTGYGMREFTLLVRRT